MSSENETVHNLKKDQFKCLLTLVTRESCFAFAGELYQQVDGVAMGFSLGPTLANIFLGHYEEIWLPNCSLDCKPSYYKRYVNDIFVFFESGTQVQSFKNLINTCHSKMKFTFEKEQHNCLNFVNVKVIKKNSVFTTSVYCVNPLLVVFTHILIVTCH